MGTAAQLSVHAKILDKTKATGTSSVFEQVFATNVSCMHERHFNTSL